MVAALGDFADARWLEPSFGRGIFLEALSLVDVPRVRIRAVDLDTHPNRNDALANHLRGVDFLDWALTTPERFDRIVANPPFVSTRILPENGRRAALAHHPNSSGKTVQQTNLWLSFLMAATKLLKPGGSLAFILPASWDYADYAVTARAELPAKFQTFHVIRSKRPLFDTVEEGSVVVLAKGFGRKHDWHTREVRRDLNDVCDALTCPLQPALPPSIAAPNCGGRLLSDVLDIRIGAVTGDAPFFILDEERRIALGLPAEACRRVVSKTRHITKATITRKTWNALRDGGEPVWLFRPPAHLEQHPAVVGYFELAEGKGGCRRDAYKVAGREVWHRTPLPDFPHAFISATATSGPWLALNGTPGLTATNTLYVARFKEARTLEERSAIGLSLLTSVARAQLKARQRLYAGGLCKFEPSDLSQISLPPCLKQEGCIKEYSLALNLLLSGNLDEASQVADKAVGLRQSFR